MKKTIKMLMSVSVYILGFSCQNNIDQEIEAMRLLKTDWSFAKLSLEQGAAEAFKAYLAEDAKLLPAGGDPIQGIETIYEIMKPGYENILFQWEPKEAAVSECGDLGYTWGEYNMTFKSNADSLYMLAGKYINIWRKNAKGEWQIILNAGNQQDPDESI